MTGIRVFVGTAGSPTHFPTPTWTEVTSRLLASSGVTYSAGVSGRGQEWAAGQFSFTLRNTDGAYSGPSLLRRPVLMRMTVGASDVDVRLVVTDVTEFREGVRRLQVSGTDLLGLASDLEVGATWDEQMTTAKVASRWLLTADGSDSRGIKPLSEDPWPDAPEASGQDFSGQSPVFGTLDGCPALSGGGVTLEPVSADGFRGLYTRLPPTKPCAWGAWCYVPTEGTHVGTGGGGGYGGCVVATIVMSDETTWGIGYSAGIPGWLYVFGTGVVDGFTTTDKWPRGQWLWITFGIDASNYITLAIFDANGTQLWTQDLHDMGTAVPVGLVLGGMTDPGSVPSPSHVQIADAVWCEGVAPATAAALIHGHIGYPGETVSARGVRLLAAAGLIPAAGTWNGSAPPAGPTLADEPWTRRPLVDALNGALDSGGFVIHDLPVTSTSVTSLGVLWPDALDGYGATVVNGSAEWDSAVVTWTDAGELWGDSIISRVMVASDGVATNTGMLTNSATVSNAKTQAQASYEDATSVSTYGRRSTTVTTWSQSSDYSASLASWLARREASPTQALGLPDLILDVNGMVDDGATAIVLAVAKTGACVAVAGLLPGGGDFAGVVRGLQWQQTPQGAVRLTLRCQPLRPLAYALLDDTATATLDDVILGW